MPRAIITFLAALILGIVQAGFVSALPETWAATNLPLIFVISYITLFRGREAYLAALGAGLSLDALSSLPPGANTVVLLGVTFFTTLLFTRIFSHRSWTGTVGLNMAAFLMLHVALAFIGSLSASLTGLAHVWFPTGEGFSTFVGALLTQTLLVVLIQAASGLAGRALTRRFILLR